VLRGLIPVATREWRTTLVGPRILIVSVILSLAVLGGTYAVSPGPGGSSGVPRFVTYSLVFYPDLNSSHPALASFAASPTGVHLSGVTVQLVKSTVNGPGVIVGSNYQVLQTKSTDAYGWVSFIGVWMTNPNVTLGLVYPDLDARFCCVSTGKASSFQLVDQGMILSQTLRLGGSLETTLSLIFTDTEGAQLASSDIFVWKVPNATSLRLVPISQQSPPDGWTGKYKVGVTDGSGYFIDPRSYPEGYYLVHASLGGINDTISFGSFITTQVSGPDSAAAFAAVLFLPIALPILALALGYDSISREKVEGTLDLLLSKPVSRTGVALGKIFGVVGSSLVPSLLIVAGATLLSWARVGKLPSGSLVSGIAIASTFLIVAFSLLFLAVSALSRSMGTALLTSVLLFLLFDFFWSFVSVLLAALGGPSGSVGWFQALEGVSLLSPSGVYQQILSFYISGPAVGPNVSTETLLQSPLPWIATSAASWVILPLGIFLWTMKSRVTEA
jgi:ABC-2 type transport system permease protein